MKKKRPFLALFFFVLLTLVFAGQGILLAAETGDVPQENKYISSLRKRAEQGDAEAQYGLGVFFANGIGVPQNETAAASWYRKAAEQGYLGHPEQVTSLASVKQKWPSCG